MAQTSWGFDGTINEAQWSEMAGLLGNGYVAADASSCITTAVGGARKVSVSAGTLYGDGIVTVLDAAEEVTLTTPANGQWYVIALRREWAGNTTSLVAIAGATTTTTTPTGPPSTLPTLNADPGVITDQPISWAWCNSANTDVAVYDMKKLPQKQANPESVASVNDRTSKFPTPVQGTTVWRNDLGALETYYDLYNVSTNPGGRAVAGWGRENGQIVQIVSANTSTSIQSTSGSYVDTGLSVTITPKYSTSKLMVFASQAGGHGAGSGVYNLKLVRDTTDVGFMAALSLLNENENYLRRSHSLNAILNANSTSATTFKTQIIRVSGTAYVEVNPDTTYASIIVIEVAG